MLPRSIQKPNLERTYAGKTMTNIERLQAYADETGDPTLTIHPIPKTGLWLVGQKPKHQWKIYICNPFQTKMCLVSKTASEHEYSSLWYALTQTKFPEKIKAAVTHAKKCVTQYKNHNQ